MHAIATSHGVDVAARALPEGGLAVDVTFPGDRGLTNAGAGEGENMSTEKQKEAARRNIEKARQVQSERAHGEDIPPSSEGLSTAEKDRLPVAEFAFPRERKEPLTNAAHVRNAIARFDQVEGVTDEERDQAWARIRTAAGKYGVDISEGDWRDLFKGGKERKR